MTKHSDPIIGGAVAASVALLNRAPEEVRAALAAQAILVLQELHQAGQLSFPSDWVDEDGFTRNPWNPETDGDEFACCLDLLGLNNRPMKDSGTNETKRRRRNEINERNAPAETVQLSAA